MGKRAELTKWTILGKGKRKLSSRTSKAAGKKKRFSQKAAKGAKEGRVEAASCRFLMRRKRLTATSGFSCHRAIQTRYISGLCSLRYLLLRESRERLLRSKFANIAIFARGLILWNQAPSAPKEAGKVPWRFARKEKFPPLSITPGTSPHFLLGSSFALIAANLVPVR